LFYCKRRRAKNGVKNILEVFFPQKYPIYPKKHPNSREIFMEENKDKWYRDSIDESEKSS